MLNMYPCFVNILRSNKHCFGCVFGHNSSQASHYIHPELISDAPITKRTGPPPKKIETYRNQIPNPKDVEMMFKLCILSKTSGCPSPFTSLHPSLHVATIGRARAMAATHRAFCAKSRKRPTEDSSNLAGAKREVASNLNGDAHDLGESPN